MLVSSTDDFVRSSRFASEKNVRFVDRHKFCEMLVSSRKLTRCDFPADRIRGVYDAESGLRFLIEEKLLFS